MLTIREEQANQFIQRRMTSYLADVFERGNPEAFHRYQGNFCRQAAVFGVKVLSELLPEYEWQAWDGDFKEKIKGREVEYNHAWIYGIHKESGKKLFVDPSRQNKEYLFREVEFNEYPKDHEEYKDMVKVRSEQMDMDVRMDEYEYYTGKHATRLWERMKKATKLERYKEKMDQ